MQKIKIIAIGKIKEAFYRDAIQEYQKRLSRYIHLQLIELPDCRIPDNASPKQEKQILKKEAEAILPLLKPGAYITALCVEGKQLDSLSFAKSIASLGANGAGELIYIIGGSLGLDDSIKACANSRLSFSQMTFPHQLMRVILLEQLYRACKINAHEVYHK